MKSIIIAIALIFPAIINLHSQQRFVKDCNEIERVKLSQGETFINNCESAYVLNPAAAREMLGTILKLDSLTKSLEKQKGILNEIINSQNKVSENYENILAIQDSSYKYLKGLQGETSNLVKQSVNNTEKALSYAKKIKFASYLTSGLIGGVAGGLIDDKDNKFGWTGAIIGTLGGVLINFGIQELF